MQPALAVAGGRREPLPARRIEAKDATARERDVDARGGEVAGRIKLVPAIRGAAGIDEDGAKQRGKPVGERMLELEAPGRDDATADDDAVDDRAERAVAVAAHRTLAARAKEHRVGNRDP